MKKLITNIYSTPGVSIWCIAMRYDCWMEKNWYYKIMIFYWLKSMYSTGTNRYPGVSINCSLSSGTLTLTLIWDEWDTHAHTHLRWVGRSGIFEMSGTLGLNWNEWDTRAHDHLRWVGHWRPIEISGTLTPNWNQWDIHAHSFEMTKILGGVPVNLFNITKVLITLHLLASNSIHKYIYIVHCTEPW